jgi:aryl carrier-like protein
VSLRARGPPPAAALASDDYALRASAPDRERILAHYPPAVAQMFRDEYLARFHAGTTDRTPGALSKIGKVNRWLHEVHDGLVANKPHIAYNAEEIEQRADNAARWCSSVNLQSAIGYTIARGVLPPIARKITAEGLYARLCDRAWWRRALRRTYTRDCENAFRHAGIVHRENMPYVTDDGARVHQENKQRSRTMLAEMQVINEQGELFSVAELAAKSVSNPTLRRGELMCRIRGFEETAQVAGHAAVFLTMTAPSCFHARHISGEANQRYNGTHVYAAQAWLQRMWARARAKLARLSIYMYGFRVTEPHHDGTPHWHALLWTAKHNADLLCKVVRDHWLSEFADEPGAAEHRFKRIDIDPLKGSAVGYVSKYIAKSIDGHAVGDDQDEGVATGLDSLTAADRIEAWARIHGIRQFAQIGGPTVTTWRELRRLRDPLDDTAPEEMELARQAADAGQWAEFIDALGGLLHCRRGFVRLWKAPAKQPNMYGEQGPDRIVGLVCHLRGYRTRFHEWRRVRPCNPRRLSGLGPVSITIRASNDISGHPLEPHPPPTMPPAALEEGETLYE